MHPAESVMLSRAFECASCQRKTHHLAHVVRRCHMSWYILHRAIRERLMYVHDAVRANSTTERSSLTALHSIDHASANTFIK